jgi:DNA mismatch endonuclease (patch repair protein)
LGLGIRIYLQNPCPSVVEFKMPDVFTKAKRSEVMSRIRSRGNRDTELAMARLLRAAGIRGWRRQVQIGGRAVLLRGPKIKAARQHRPTFRVKPDFVFPKLKLAVFVDGCFWHGCPKHATWPASRAAWWRRKIEGNKTRDRVVNRALRRAGWKVVRVWEHELQRPRGEHRTFNIQHSTSNVDRVVQRIEKHLK